MTFARESLKVVLPPLILAVIARVLNQLLDWPVLNTAAIILFVIAIVFLLFFRDPKRNIPADSDSVVSPADGRVLLTETMEDGRKRIAIFMSVFNVHVNRCPVSGKVLEIENTPGRYLNAAAKDAPQKNARVRISAETKAGIVEWLQVSGLIARKISCRLKVNDLVTKGVRFGLIYFGSRLEVFLPDTAQPCVQPGQKVRAGESVIAKLDMR